MFTGDGSGGLMGICMDTIDATLTSKIAITRGEENKTNVTGIQASVTCDSLAKEIYAGIYRLVVDEINDTLCTQKTENHHQHWIGLLDLFGFEQFSKNQFEQLCINYVNEKLQQKYIFENFKSVQEEYLSEGIEYSCNISWFDNTDCLGLYTDTRTPFMSNNYYLINYQSNNKVMSSPLPPSETW